jgi:hypothetical protein
MELYDEIEKEFENWFNDFYGRFSFRVEHFYEDCEVEDVKTRRELLRKWMVTSFHEGYERGMYKKLEEEQSE